MIFAAILAGGIGSRMNIADMPKQFLNLGDKPIIIHTIEKFLLCQRIDKLYLGVHPSWTGYMSDLLEQHFGAEHAITVVAGGADRNETLFNVIDRIEGDFGESEEHIILTHDAVRPFISLRIIEENIDAAKKYGAVDTAYGAVDTIVISADGKFIDSVPERKQMFQGQTPQSFKISLLKKLYASLSDEEKSILTDACKICVVRDCPVYIVQGDSSNMKITTANDYKIAQAMLGGIDCD